MKSNQTTKKGPVLAATAPRALVSDLCELIQSARETVALAVESALTTLYWQIGRRVRQDILKSKRSDYGAEILSSLGRRLAAEFVLGFYKKSLRPMIRFAEAFPDERIVSALRRQLTWTHFKQFIDIDHPLKRDFYAEMCRIERWSTRALEKKISGMLFERTPLSRKPKKLAAMELNALREEDKMTPDLMFSAPYLRWLDRHERKEGEEAPIGLILCAGQRRETIGLLDLEAAGIRVSSYWTDVLPKQELKRKLHQAVLLARARLGPGSGADPQP